MVEGRVKVKARSAGVCASKGQAASRCASAHHPTRPAGHSEAQRRVNQFDVQAAALPWPIHLDAYTQYIYSARMNSPTHPRRDSAVGPRKRTTMTIRPDYLADAKRLGITVSEAAERGLRDAIREAEAAR